MCLRFAEKAMATHPSTLAWKNPRDGGAWWAAVHGVARSRTWLSDFTFTFHFHALEKEMATHSSVLAWRIPGMGEPGGLLSMGSHRVGHDWSDLAAAAAAAAWGLRGLDVLCALLIDYACFKYPILIHSLTHSINDNRVTSKPKRMTSPAVQ